MSAHEAISAAAKEGEAAAAAVPTPDVPMKDCPKCNHNIFDVVDGKKVFVRRHNGRGRYSDGHVSGVCFKCGGAGVIPATRAGQRALNQAKAEQDLLRLRVMYRAVRRALRDAEAALQALGPKPKGADREVAKVHFRARMDVKDLADKLKQIETYGKDAAAKAANPHARAR